MDNNRQKEASMKNAFALFSIVCIICVGLSGCVYSSVNLASIQSDNTTVFGAWGYVHCGQNSRILFYRSQQSSNLKKGDMPSWPTVPTVTTDPANVNIGKPNKSMPKDKIITPDAEPSALEQAAVTATTGVPLPK